MGKKIEQDKKNNINKIRIGFCIELSLLLDSFYNDFFSLYNSIVSNSQFLDSQKQQDFIRQFESIKELLNNNICILLSEVDKDEEYCQYMNRFY